MRLSKVLTATAFAGVMALAATGPASATTVGGITFPAGAVFKSTNIFENVVTAAGQVLDGIGFVNNISATGGTPVWSNGDNGRELTFQFAGYTVEKIIAVSLVSSRILFSGGTVDFYSDSAQNFTDTSGTQATDIARATDTDLSGAWLNLVGAATNTFTCDAAAACFSGVGTAITLDSTVFFNGDLGTVTSGTGIGFLDVVGGLAAGNFDTNSQPSGQDILLGSNFAGDQSGTSDFPITGTADLRSTAIPEPGTLALFGFGLLGLGFAARRRRRKLAA